jgi:hypothetical protein
VLRQAQHEGIGIAVDARSIAITVIANNNILMLSLSKHAKRKREIRT